ncbi:MULTISPECIES: glucose-6-phosphate 1-dehydrogenase family protein [Limosilactobacillus]|uniref:Glucose-6-phosphate 1-dehydrogenase family protein n=1 Tax=Limosilactobacillus balticus TaxID=2759747 RepID=A0ABS8RCB5_9LACO|nr:MULTISPECIES: glucose-6-phosphate 1-dehydrogenase family protein [Limosilactobacillus]MBB1127781.1 glucose-6-phosphate 1-dehydrogenase family protein [Limosilactobacillus balticus]MCD7136716.1 glucose-6-phosphate 1-dehydrogenase family protein [Limosilactobacillus balticus]MCD7138628.1 glucose-6-phosphate 1-dehydrogenase family protein [Limosilactobacillus balticus]MDE7040901.1 glucose-6-phosphate 1-dehydrogenase family protein [Limosilactobacillus sp.]
MTALSEDMFAIFDQPEFSFKKIKENQSPEEVAELKEKFKAVWQVWKKVNQTVASQLPPDQFAKVHVESWTNGWNLRNHYWASYRLASLADYNPCIGVMLDKNQLQVYLMFQHYKSEQRQGTVDEYNQLLDRVPEWADNIDATHWYLWDKNEMEFSDHLLLTKYLNNHDIQQQFNSEARKTSFLLGKFAFRGKDQVDDMEEYISSVIRQLTPLYEELK